MAALKHRLNLVNCFTMPVGSSDIVAHSVCKLDSSALVVATANTEATAFFITTETGYGGREVRCAGIGSICFVIAIDDAIAEGDILGPDTGGRVDTIVSLGTASQYTVGRALCASSAAAQLIPILYYPEVATKQA